MGPAHASSAGAILLVAALLGVVFEWSVWTSANLAIIAQSFLIAAGAGLTPDIDNTKSTSQSSLWFAGNVLSFFMRGSSRIIQTTIRTKKDDTSPNPHRGFWHTMVGSGLLGFGALILTRLDGDVTIAGIDTTWGRFWAFVVAATLTHLALAGVAGSTVKKIKNASILGELAAGFLSIGITAFLFMFVSSEDNYYWLALSVFIGSTGHIIGDCFTKAGAPIFFPLTALTRGKFWWVTRFAYFSADNKTANSVIIKISEIIALVAFIGIAYFTYAQ